VGPVATSADSAGAILIADPDAPTRKELAQVFERAGLRTAQAANGQEALELLRADRPAAAILDPALAGVTGYELCRILRDRFGESVAIVFVSGNRTEPYDRVGGLLLGGDDYVAKPFAADELVARVRRLIRRSDATPPITASRLTKRELEVLRLLADGLTQAEIASKLVISQKTVGSHIERILSKLGVRSRTQAVALAFREDLVPV
jgi:DNA-binding NarL/FixJ family response regulator